MSQPAEVKPTQVETPPLSAKQKQEVALLQANLRKDFAREAENRFLSSGLDFTVKASGKGNTTITYTYILMSRPMVYKLVNESNLLRDLKTIGFKKVTFDGYDYRSSYDLTKD